VVRHVVVESSERDGSGSHEPAAAASRVDLATQ
jgi:hypothetical protein